MPSHSKLRPDAIDPGDAAPVRTPRLADHIARLGRHGPHVGDTSEDIVRAARHRASLETIRRVGRLRPGRRDRIECSMDYDEREALRAMLADPTIPKSQFELHRVRRRIFEAHRTGGLQEGDFHDLSGVVAALLGDFEDAVDHCTAAMRAGSTIARQYDLGTALYQAGRLSEAVAVFDDLAVRHTSMALRVARASCALALGDRDVARQLLQDALLRVRTERPGDMVRLIPALVAAGMHDEALLVFAVFLCAAHGVCDVDEEIGAHEVIRRAPTEVLERVLSISPIDLRPVIAARARASSSDGEPKS